MLILKIFLIFNNCKYKILIDVRCMQNGELQYRVQRLMKYEKAE